MPVPNGMKHAHARKNGALVAAPRMGLVKATSQVRNPEGKARVSARRAWIAADPKPATKTIAVTKFERGDRFGWTVNGSQVRAVPSARQDWRRRKSVSKSPPAGPLAHARIPTPGYVKP